MSGSVVLSGSVVRVAARAVNCIGSGGEDCGFGGAGDGFEDCGFGGAGDGFEDFGFGGAGDGLGS